MGSWSQVLGLYEVSAVGGVLQCWGLGGEACGGTLGGSDIGHSSTSLG